MHPRAQRSELLQADFSVSSSGETYWAVPTNELALADEKRQKGRGHTETPSAYNRGHCGHRSLIRVLRFTWVSTGAFCQHSTVPPNPEHTLLRACLAQGPPHASPSWTLSSKGWLIGHLLSDTYPDHQGSPTTCLPGASHQHLEAHSPTALSAS